MWAEEFRTHIDSHFLLFLLFGQGQVMVAPQCTFIHSAEQQLQWEHSVVEGMCIDEDRVSADTEKEVAGASSSSVPRDETPPKEEVWTKSLGEEDAQQVLEFAQKKMPHLKEMAEGDEGFLSQKFLRCPLIPPLLLWVFFSPLTFLVSHVSFFLTHFLSMKCMKPIALPAIFC